MTFGPENSGHELPGFSDVAPVLEQLEQWGVPRELASSLGAVLLNGTASDYELRPKSDAEPQHSHAPSEKPEEAETDPRQSLINLLIEESPVTVQMFDRQGKVTSQFNRAGVKAYDWQEEDQRRLAYLESFRTKPYADQLSKKVREVVWAGWALNPQGQAVRYSQYANEAEPSEEPLFKVNYVLGDEKGRPVTGVEIATTKTAAEHFIQTTRTDGRFVRDLLAELWRRDRINESIDFGEAGEGQSLDVDQLLRRHEAYDRQAQAATDHINHTFATQQDFDTRRTNLLIIDDSIVGKPEARVIAVPPAPPKPKSNPEA